MARAHYHLNLNLDEPNEEWYHSCDTTFAGRGASGITRMIPLAPAGIPIGIPVHSVLCRDGFLLESIRVQMGNCARKTG